MRDAVVVVERDQLVELPGAGQRAGLVADAFHQAAVAEEDVGVVVDDRVARAVELGGQQLLGQRHADRVGDALAERAGGGLDARRDADLGVARRLAVQLAEVAQLAHRQVVAGQVQQRVEQHRAVAVGEHEAVAVGPVRVGRVVAQVACPTAPPPSRPCPSARRGGRSWPAAPRPSPGRGWRWPSAARRGRGRSAVGARAAMGWSLRCEVAAAAESAILGAVPAMRPYDPRHARTAPHRRPARLRRRTRAAMTDAAALRALCLAAVRGSRPARRWASCSTASRRRRAARAGGRHRRGAAGRVAPGGAHLARARRGDAGRLRVQPRRRQLGARPRPARARWSPPSRRRRCERHELARGARTPGAGLTGLKPARGAAGATLQPCRNGLEPCHVATLP